MSVEPTTTLADHQASLCAQGYDRLGAVRSGDEYWLRLSDLSLVHLVQLPHAVREWREPTARVMVRGLLMSIHRDAAEAREHYQRVFPELRQAA